MTSDRIKEIQETTAYPESRSVKQALLQVWNECEQDSTKYSEEEVGELVYNIIGEYGKHYGIMIDGAKLNDLFNQFKK